MINNTQHTPCTDAIKYRRLWGVEANRGTVSVTVNLSELREDRMRRDLNVMLGQCSPCKCESCSPDSSNG